MHGKMGTSLDLEVLIWCSWNSLMIYVFRMWAFGQAAASTIDYMIDSVAAAHPSDPYLSTAKIDDRLVVVGNPDKPLSINALSLINGKPNHLDHNLALFCQSLTPHKFTGQGCFELHNAK
jgi:hypothetical protein